MLFVLVLAIDQQLAWRGGEGLTTLELIHLKHSQGNVRSGESSGGGREGKRKFLFWLQCLMLWMHWPNVERERDAWWNVRRNQEHVSCVCSDDASRWTLRDPAPDTCVMCCSWKQLMFIYNAFWFRLQQLLVPTQPIPNPLLCLWKSLCSCIPLPHLFVLYVCCDSVSSHWHSWKSEAENSGIFCLCSRFNKFKVWTKLRWNGKGWFWE